MRRLTTRTYVGGKEYTDLVGVQMEYIANPYKRERIQAATEKLADYEDAEQEGRIFSFPVKVGGIVWDIDAKPWHVESIEFLSKTDIYLNCKAGTKKQRFYAGKGYIGKTVFLSKAEAENAYWRRVDV